MNVSNYWTNINNFSIAQRLYMNMNPDKLKTDLKESKEIKGCRGSIIIQELVEDLGKKSRELTKDNLASAAVGYYSGYLTRVIKRPDMLGFCCKLSLIFDA